MFAKTRGSILLAVILLAPLTARGGGFLIDNTSDSGPGSLRAAIEAANAMPGPHVIGFAEDLAGTIALKTPLPDLVEDMELLGPGAALVTVSGNDSQRLFVVGSGATVYLSGLTLTGGMALMDDQGVGGAIWNFGHLTVADAAIEDNKAEFAGGGISNDGTLVVLRTRISGNQAFGDFSLGGGIENFQGSMTLLESVVSSAPREQPAMSVPLSAPLPLCHYWTWTRHR